MSTFEQELRACLGLVLGSTPPAPDFDAVTFYKQWLGETNLGLVPIADPATFSWPGEWLARVRGAHRDHAVLMYGSPSGAIHDPDGALASGGTIEEGWLVAPLDLHVPIEQPWGRDAGAGAVAGLLVAAEAEAAMRRVESVEAIAGSGLADDRYGQGAGTFSGKGRGYELTLVEAEVLTDVDLSWEGARRNIVTQGIALNALVGRPFTVGDVECIGRRLAEPCSHLEKLSGAGIMRPLVHRAGLRADILIGGTIAVGDAVAAAD